MRNGAGEVGRPLGSSLGKPVSRRAFGPMLLGLLVAASRMAAAQGSTAVRRVGILGPGVPETAEETASRAKLLREFGWVEGRNLQVERRYANDRPEALRGLAEELVRAKVEVIVTSGTPATLAAKRATTTIPIVFESAGDPVLLGLVASLARPGGNVTGFSLASPEVTAKRLTVLKELLPALRRIGVLEASWNPYFRAARPQFEQTCRSLGLEPVFLEVATPGEIDGAMAQMARQRAQAVVLRADTFLYDHRFEITTAAIKHGLPTMGSHRLLHGRLAPWPPTPRRWPRKSAKVPATSTGSCAEQSQPTSQSSRLRGSSWSSISRRPRRSA